MIVVVRKGGSAYYMKMARETSPGRPQAGYLVDMVIYFRKWDEKTG
jgi:hypothetical protein